jgi:glycerol uptake facilitator-like aquaporin
MDWGALIAAVLLLPWMGVMALAHQRLPGRNSAGLIGLGLIFLGVANAGLTSMSVVPALSVAVSLAAVGFGGFLLLGSLNTAE